MRIWSLHPRLLDRAALVAGWREALLARAVLAGGTRGYRHHPQLQRFQAHPQPLAAIDAYLHGLHDEATARGYRFDAAKLGARRPVTAIDVTTGQLACEWAHLRRKVAARAPQWLPRLEGDAAPACHSLFRAVAGPVEAWERLVADDVREVAVGAPALPPPAAHRRARS